MRLTLDRTRLHWQQTQRLVDAFYACSGARERGVSMASLFGKAKKKSSAKSTADTIISLQETIDSLEKRNKYLDTRIHQQLVEAKQKAKAKNQNGALICLKKKRMYEREVEKLNGSIMTMESQKIALESAAVNSQILKTMKTGTAHIRELHKETNPEEVDKVLEDLEEQMQEGEEIAEAFSRPIGIAADLDDDDLLAELNELTEEDTASSLFADPTAEALPVNPADAAPVMPDAPTGVIMPEAPAGPIAAGGGAEAVTKEEDASLRELEASLAL